MPANAQIISVSLPKTEERWLTRTARSEKKTKSALVREALRQYQLNREWQGIRRWGARTAIKLGITSYDDVDRIAGKR